MIQGAVNTMDIYGPSWVDVGLETLGVSAGGELWHLWGTFLSVIGSWPSWPNWDHEVTQFSHILDYFALNIRGLNGKMSQSNPKYDPVMRTAPVQAFIEKRAAKWKDCWWMNWVLTVWKLQLRLSVWICVEFHVKLFEEPVIDLTLWFEQNEHFWII